MQQSILGARLCRVQQRVNKSHYQSKRFVCLLDNHADVFAQLLIAEILSVVSLLTDKKGKIPVNACESSI